MPVLFLLRQLQFGIGVRRRRYRIEAAAVMETGPFLLLTTQSVYAILIPLIYFLFSLIFPT